jgi:hypothetical protein
MLWLLVQPPEGGGLGMDPLAARKLTLEEAHFYLSSENRVKNSCRRMNAVGEDGVMPEPEELRRQFNEYMATTREYFTGSRELKWE